MTVADESILMMAEREALTRIPPIIDREDGGWDYGGAAYYNPAHLAYLRQGDIDHMTRVVLDEWKRIQP